ncbi:MAG: T9SS type A sorting domain-containing protein [Janthinobacterium lividum]
MKKLFTLAAAGMLASASLSAQAQVVLDGVLNTSEIGGTSGYVLIGKYTNARGFGNAGLLSLYVATTATKVTFFMGGTVETNQNSFQLFFKTPAGAGVPAGTALPTGPAGGGTITSSAGTSFDKMGAKLDMPTNLAIALRSTVNAAGTTTFKLEGISYTSATAATTEPALTGAVNINGATGAATPITATTIPALVSSRVAYKVSSGGGVDTNPGYSATPNTSTTYGGAGSYGMEFELDRAAASLTGTVAMQVFALQNSGDGGFLSTDFIPQSTAAAAATTATNPGGNPDFGTIPGTQAATLNLTATAVALATKAADAAAIGLSVYPNPSRGAAVVSYRVADQASTVHIALTDLLGRTVRTVEKGNQPVGNQTADLNTANLAAGTYLVRVQVGEQVSTSKIAVL